MLCEANRRAILENKKLWTKKNYEWEQSGRGRKEQQNEQGGNLANTCHDALMVDTSQKLHYMEMKSSITYGLWEMAIC